MKKNEIVMLRFDEVSAIQNSIEDSVTRNLLGAALTIVVRRFMSRQDLPVSNFDMVFFSEAMIELFEDHVLVKNILDEIEIDGHRI